MKVTAQRGITLMGFLMVLVVVSFFFHHRRKALSGVFRIQLSQVSYE